MGAIVEVDELVEATVVAVVRAATETDFFHFHILLTGAASEFRAVS